jgi:VWFA-related protein
LIQLRLRAIPAGVGLWILIKLAPITLLPVFSAAQQSGPAGGAAAPPQFHVSVDRVQIGAVVTDSKGRPVTDLGIGDFSVQDGGKAQQLTACEYIRLATPEAAAQPAPRRRGRQDPLALPPPATQGLTRPQVQRTIVFLIDDESFGFGVIPAVQEAVRTAVDRSLKAGDMAALIRTSSGNSSLEQLTSDKRILLESAAKISWRPGSRGNPGMLPQVSGAVAGEENGRYLVANSQYRTTAVLKYVMSALRDLPGRKAIIFISQSLPTGMNYFDPHSSSAGATDVGKLVDEALRAGVVVYCVDPTPLSSLTPGADYDVTHDFTVRNGAKVWVTRQAAAAQLNGYTHRSLVIIETLRSGLYALAEGTGGQMAADTDTESALERFAADLQGYYLLTYRPLNPERYFATRRGEPAPFRSVKIQVARAGTHVRSYAGYIASSGDAAREAPVGGEISQALFSPFSAAGVRVELTAIFTQPRPASPELSLLLHVDAADLGFTAAENGEHVAEFNLVARVAGEPNQPAEIITRHVALRLNERTFTETMRMGVTYRTSIPAPRAGLHEVRAAVQDAATGRLGSAREFVEVPELKNGRMALSGVLVFNAQTAQTDAQAPGLAERRLFRPKDNLSYACQVFNAQTVAAEARIVRDGTLVSTTAAGVVENGDGTSTAKGALALATLAPGRYILQIVTVDAAKKAASQWTDFELVP